VIAELHRVLASVSTGDEERLVVVVESAARSPVRPLEDLVLPQIHGGPDHQPPPLLGIGSGVTITACPQRAPEFGHALRVSVHEPSDQTIQQLVDEPWRLGRRKSGIGRPGDGSRIPQATRRASADSSAKRFEIELAGEWLIER
jgi:hypothetical protein